MVKHQCNLLADDFFYLVKRLLNFMKTQKYCYSCKTLEKTISFLELNSALSLQWKAEKVRKLISQWQNLLYLCLNTIIITRTQEVSVKVLHCISSVSNSIV